MRTVQGWAIFKTNLLLILPDEAASQSLIQALRTGIVFFNGNEERHLLLVSFTYQVLNQRGPNALVLIVRQELDASQGHAGLRPHHAESSNRMAVRFDDT